MVLEIVLLLWSIVELIYTRLIIEMKLRCTKSAIGASDVVHVLAEHDSDINLKNAQQHTALHLASKYGHGDCVKMLLGFASNPNLQDAKGDTAAHFAARGGI